MYSSGVLEVHDNVVFEANTAGSDGGAVSLPFDIVFLLLAAVFFYGVCGGWFDLLRQLPKPLWNGLSLSSNYVCHSLPTHSPLHAGLHVFGRRDDRARQCGV